jgi:hypothetical protein
MRAASVNGRSSTKYTPRAHRTQRPDSTRRSTARLLSPALPACSNVITPS